LLLYGVHIGHSFLNSIAFAGWLVYTYKQNILIINLFKTTIVIKNGYTSINQAVKFLNPI
jgi:ribosomal protein S2